MLARGREKTERRCQIVRTILRSIEFRISRAKVSWLVARSSHLQISPVRTQQSGNPTPDDGVQHAMSNGMSEVTGSRSYGHSRPCGFVPCTGPHCSITVPAVVPHSLAAPICQIDAHVAVAKPALGTAKSTLRCHLLTPGSETLYSTSALYVQIPM